MIIRENTEGEYSGLEHESIPGVVESIKVRKNKFSMVTDNVFQWIPLSKCSLQIVTRDKIERIARMAYDYAVLNNRKKVSTLSVIHMKLTYFI